MYKAPLYIHIYKHIQSATRYITYTYTATGKRAFKHISESKCL